MQLVKSKKKLTLKHIIQSVLGAFIGIQNRQHADTDFKHGNIYVYVAAGIFGVLIFIAIIAGVVKWVLA